MRALPLAAGRNEGGHYFHYKNDKLPALFFFFFLNSWGGVKFSTCFSVVLNSGGKKISRRVCAVSRRVCEEMEAGVCKDWQVIIL